MNLPLFIAPELATAVDKPPAGEAWLHEIKLDGYRMIARLEKGSVALFSRNGLDWTAKAPSVASALALLPAKNAFVDGEVVVFDTEGRTSFAALKDALGGKGENRIVFQAFDLLFLDGRDIRRLPLVERKTILRDLIKRTDDRIAGRVRYSDHKLGEGPEFFAAACRHGLEGIISKRADSVYISGRGLDWLKVKCMRRQELVVVGYTPPSKGDFHVGSLVLAVYDKRGKLIYAGRVGTGFDLKERARLKTLLDRRAVRSSPLEIVPRDPGLRGTTWARPELVAEIEFGDWTRDGRLRHPSYKGLREDKEPSSVVREEEKDVKTAIGRGKGTKVGSKAASETSVAGVRLTNPNRILYPKHKITKIALARYYEAIQELMLPHIERRPLTLVRCPEGHTRECFFQKHPANPVPSSIQLVKVKEEQKTRNYMWVKDATGIVALVQLGTLEFHMWGSRVDRLEYPDRIVFDLDPASDVPSKRVVEAAFEVRERLKRLDLVSFVMTTGGKGLHIVFPVERRHNFDEIKAFTRAFADSMVKESPTKYVAEASLHKRKGKIFVDYLRNGRGATAICPYSTRAREGAPVATPLRWEELRKEGIDGARYNIETMLTRVARMKRDPWAEYAKVKQRLTGSVMTRALKGRI